MKHLFYFVAVLFIINELSWILDPFGKANKNRNFKRERESNEKNGKTSWDQWSEMYKGMILTIGVPNFFFLTWIIVGFFSFNSLVFLTFFLFNLTIIAPISKYTIDNIAFYAGLHYINSWIGLVFASFVIFNSYHLHIDIYELVISWFNN